MTSLLRSLLRDNYIAEIKAMMLSQHHNNTSLSRRTGYSKAHIGNVLKGDGSDDALAAVCTVLGLDIKSLFKDSHDLNRAAGQ